VPIPRYDVLIRALNAYQQWVDEIENGAPVDPRRGQTLLDQIVALLLDPQVKAALNARIAETNARRAGRRGKGKPKRSRKRGRRNRAVGPIKIRGSLLDQVAEILDNEASSGAIRDSDDLVRVLTHAYERITGDLREVRRLPRKLKKFHKGKLIVGTAALISGTALLADNGLHFDKHPCIWEIAVQLIEFGALTVASAKRRDD
jgi:hypothetical protein